MYKVFLVDDDALIVEQIKNSVPWMENGFEVAGCECDPKKAVEQVINLKPHVIFIDLKMPNMDGHKFMRIIREHKLDTQFVMLSAYGTFEDARTFFQQEGFDYLLKPLQLPEVQLVLEKLAEKLSKKYPLQVDHEEEIANPAFLELIEYVKINFNNKFTLEQLSRDFGLSAGYICNLFAKYYNTTLTRFITRIRMEYAVNRIRESEFSLKQIALECGYRDYFYFNKVFKGYYGVAPSQYIKEINMND